MSLDAEIDFSSIVRGFRAMDRKANERARDFFIELRPSARNDIKQHQKDRQGESGAWAPRSPESRARAQYASKPRKRRKSGRTGLLGNLPKSWKATADGDALTLTHYVSWASAHDSGATVGRGARLPRRQFAFWSREFSDSAARQFQAYVLKGWTETK